MITKFKPFFCLYFLVLCISPAFSLDPYPWFHFYGGENTDVVQDTLEMKDGNIAVLSATTSFSKGKWGAWLFALDSQGRMVWETVYGTKSVDFPVKMVELEDGSFIIAGGTERFLDQRDEETWVFRADKTGKILWEKFLGSDGKDSCTDLIRTRDGNIAVLHNLNLFSRVQIVRMDLTGMVLGELNYRTSKQQHGNSLVETRDGGFAFTGYTDKGILFAKLTSAGRIEIDKTLSGNSNKGNSGLCLIQTGEGDYLITGCLSDTDDNKQDFLLLKLDLQGAVVWKRTYHAGTFNSGRFIAPTRDGNLVIGGKTTTQNRNGNLWNDDFYVLKVDPDGKVIWERILGTDSNDDVTEIIETRDGGLIVSGDVDDASWKKQRDTRDEDCLVVSMKSDGTIPAAEEPMFPERKPDQERYKNIYKGMCYLAAKAGIETVAKAKGSFSDSDNPLFNAIRSDIGTVLQVSSQYKGRTLNTDLDVPPCKGTVGVVYMMAKSFFQIQVIAPSDGERLLEGAYERLKAVPGLTWDFLSFEK